MEALRQNAEHVALAHEDEVVAAPAVLELVAGPGGEQHLVADLELRRGAGSVRLHRAGPDREDGAALRLVLGAIREEDAAGGLRVGGFTANDDAVANRFEAHSWFLRAESRLVVRAMQLPCPPTNHAG